MVQDLEHADDSSRLWVERPKHQSRDACMNHGSGAHRAGFQSYIQRTAFQSIVAERLPSRAQSNDFRMRAGIMVADHAVLSSSKDRSIAMQDDRSDRHFTSRSREFCLQECLLDVRPIENFSWLGIHSSQCMQS